MERYKEIERSIIKKYRKEIWSRFARAVGNYELIKENDKVMVCISGGKDSAVSAALFTKALGKENVIGVTMPCHSKEEDREHDPESRKVKLVSEDLRSEDIAVELLQHYDEYYEYQTFARLYQQYQQTRGYGTDDGSEERYDIGSSNYNTDK